MTRPLVLLLCLSLSSPTWADTGKPVSVRESLAWSITPVVADYSATLYCIHSRPGCYETNRRLWIAPVVIAGTVAADRWLSKVNRTAMWAARILRSLYHGFLCVRALTLGGAR